VDVRETASGFDWGNAGIGAAGMLALFSITAGSMLLIAGRRAPWRVPGGHPLRRNGSDPLGGRLQPWYGLAWTRSIWEPALKAR
jgi:hypothetical protein